jgi:gamma-glutamyl hydrolase
MLDDARFANYKTYIMKSYVDSVEAAGARVVPLINGEPEDVTIEKLKKVNGVLFPGGDGDYLEYGRFVFKAIKEFNDQGTFYPIWGTCMGYENIVSYVSDNGWDVLSVYDYETGSMAMEFTVDPRKTKMYSWLGDKAFLFENYNVTYNAHHWGMNPEKFKTDKGLSQLFYHTAISYMPDGRPFVASVES